MSYKGLFETAKKVQQKNNKSKIIILFDIIYCGLKYQAGYMDYYLFEMYKLNNKQLLLEEIAIQCEEISKLHPTSINTIRVITLKGKVAAAYLRIGNHNKVVDNFNSEGLATPVNTESGIIEYPAIDKHDNLYEVHPITKIKIIGFKIPNWNKVIKLCVSASKEIPQIGYVGWDVCVGEKDVFFIEGNEFPGHDIYQLPPHRKDGIGLYPKFKKIMEEE